MHTGPKRWDITREVFSNRPYRVHVPPEQLRLLEIQYLKFVRTAQTRDAIEAMLGEATDCPPERLQALRMTLGNGLYLAARTGRGGRLIEWMRDPNEGTSEQITDLGVRWLQAQGYEENLDAEPA